MVKAFLTTAMLLVASYLFARQAAPDPRYKLVNGNNIVQQRIITCRTLKASEM